MALKGFDAIQLGLFRHFKTLNIRFTEEKKKENTHSLVY